MSGAPGLRPAELFNKLDDSHAAQLLPPGAFKLISTLRPELLAGDNRSATLGRLLSLELAMDDPIRRRILLSAVPATKTGELEGRTATDLREILEAQKLSPATRRALLGFFGLATVRKKATKDFEPIRAIPASRGLFPHQKRAASAVERFLYQETGRAMLHLPTGAGKTRTAMSIVASHLRSRPSGLVLWLAATRELLEQAATEFEDTWKSSGDRPINSYRFWANHSPPLDEANDGIIIAGLAKLHSYGKQRQKLWRLGDCITFVIFDEAHQAVAKTYGDLVETIVTRKPRTPLLGLSATPGRTWNNPEEDAKVADLFHGNKVTLDFSDENPIKRLTKEGYLATADFSLLNVEPGLKLSPADVAELSAALEITSALAMRLGDDEQRNLRILQRLFALVTEHSRIIVFAASVRNAVLLSSVCRAAGLEADAVTNATDTIERERMITRFKRPGGAHRILINYGVLTTGFDAPTASAVLIARPTKSLVLYSQMVGRVIRGPRAGGTDRCEVITVVDTTLPGFGDVTQAFMNWEDIWTT